MDEKTELPLPNARLTVDDRLDELTGRLKIRAEMFKRLESQTRGLDSKNTEIINRTKKVAAETGSAYTDSDWVAALQEANVPEDQILNIWNIKDELASKEKDRKNQSSAA